MKSRRDFIKSASLGSAMLFTPPPWILKAESTTGEDRIENQFFIAGFDAGSGKIQVDRKDGSALLRNAIARAPWLGRMRATSDPEYHRTISIRPCQDRLGKGRQISARCVDRRKQIDFEILLTLYDGRNAVVVEVLCRNTSSREFKLPYLEPLRAVLEEGGACGWPDAGKALTNGYLYADPGRVEELGGSDRHAVTSMWNIGFYRGAQQEGLVVGYLENNIATGRISALYDRTVEVSGAQGAISLVAQSLYSVDHVLKPGATVTSGRIIFNIAPDPFTALETYAQAVADAHQVHLNPIVNGWCSWYYTHEYINEDEILRNAAFAARSLRPYGLEFIQVDAGWYRTYGDWEGNQNFPHGMRWLAGKIRELGLRPGIWVAPYCIAEGTDVFQHHQDWLITDGDGRVKQCGGGAPSNGGEYGIPSMAKKIYGLDITHPAAAGWMHNLFARIAEDWGYDFIKIDFVEWTILSAARYHDPTCSQAAAYRKGFEIIRGAIGSNRHLLDCGPMNNTVGLIDSARIEADLPRLTWEQYTGNFNSNAPAMAKRYYFNRKTWTNDADHLGLALLTLPQSRAAATIIAMSGGTMISGDRLVDLDADRLEILRKVYPSWGAAARPVDLFEADRPGIFALPLKTKFAEWIVLALFNWENHSTEKQVPLDQLGLRRGKTYLAFDFWNQRIVSEVEQDLRVVVEPESVALLSLHERAETPFVIATDRHFTQGAVEIEEVTWEDAAQTLSGTSIGPVDTAHNISVYVPRQYRWDSELPEYFHEMGQYSLKKAAPDILRVHVRFETDTATNWQVKFARV